MTIATGRLFLPRITNGPLLSSRKESVDRHEDWSHIEAMLASTDPADGAARAQSRRRSMLLGSAFAASIACCTILAVATWATQTTCRLQANGCPAPIATLVPPETTTPVAAAHVPSAQRTRTADAGGQPADSHASSPVVQGRSVGANEIDANGSAQPSPLDDVLPVHHRHHHHHRR